MLLDLIAEKLTRRAKLPITLDNQQRELGTGFGSSSNLSLFATKAVETIQGFC